MAHAKEDRQIDTKPPERGGFWEDLWTQGVDRGDMFDKHVPLPELQRRVERSQIPGGSLALIPGCGRGYDVELLTRAGLFERVVGVDISPTGASTAREYLASVSPKLTNDYEIMCADFFNDRLPAADFVYDYTFFCAIYPAQRAAWGRRMAEIVNPGGTLVTIIYPDVEKDGGPPFAVNINEYQLALSHAFSVKDGPVLLKEGQAHPGRELKSWWVAWERNST